MTMQSRQGQCGLMEEFAGHASEIWLECERASWWRWEQIVKRYPSGDAAVFVIDGKDTDNASMCMVVAGEQTAKTRHDSFPKRVGVDRQERHPAEQR